MELYAILPSDTVDTEPVTQLAIAHRTANNLLRNGVRTLGELRAFSVDQLLTFYGFGVGMADELLVAVRALCYALEPSGRLNRQRSQRLAQPAVLSLLLQRRYTILSARMLDAQRPEIAVSLTECGMSRCALYAFEQQHLLTLRDLLAATPAQIIACGSYGHGCLIEVITFLEQQFKDSVSGLDAADRMLLFGADVNHDEQLPDPAPYLQLLVAADDATLPLERLILPPKLAARLRRSGLTTVGHFAADGEAWLAAARSVTVDFADRLLQRLQLLHAAQQADGSLDWIVYLQSCGLTVLASDPRSADPLSLFEGLPELLQAILTTDADERDWLVICYRYGLNGKERRTLEEIGSGLTLTRERVRQIEVRALATLRSVLFDSNTVGHTSVVHPRACDAFRRVCDAVAALVQDGLPDITLEQSVCSALGLPTLPLRPFMPLLAELLNLKREQFTIAALQPYWNPAAGGRRELRRLLVTQLHELLLDYPVGPLDPFELLMVLNQRLARAQRISQQDLLRLLPLCSSVEHMPDGRLQAKLPYLRTRADQAVRILIEHGEPLEIAEIARAINAVSVAAGRRELELRNLSNQLLADPRCAAIGRSGIWALANWEHVSTDLIIDLMERCLIEHNMPLTAEQIYAYVRERRPVQESSIHLYLSTRADCFRRVNFTEWARTSWKQIGPIWDRVEVGEFVADIFRQHGVTKMPLGELAQALAAAASISERSASAVLGHHPVVSTFRGKSGQTVAFFQPNYRVRLTRPRTMRRKRTTRLAQIQAHARELLRDQPQRSLVLTDLVHLLERRYGYVRASLYAAIQRDRAIFKHPLPERRTSLCVLRAPAAMPELADLTD